MIHTNRTVTVGNQESIIDSPIILYRGDREVEVEFTLNGNKFTFTNGGNVIKSTNATHGQLVINTPTGENMFSEVTECNEGKVVFLITKEMIDELIEIGFYSFQIRLFDESQVSRVTIPPVFQGIDIRNPIAAEDETNVVDISLVDYAIVQKDEYENLATFLPDGSYNKTDWESRGLITEAKLDKIEDALYTINENMEASDLSIFNRIESINRNVNGQITEFRNEADAEIKAFERSINTNVEQFKIDTNAAMTAHKNEVSEELGNKASKINMTDWINVSEFGISNDGEIDVTDKLQELLDDCRNGSVIFFPKGVYLISKGIKINKSITLLGNETASYSYNENDNAYSVIKLKDDTSNVDIIKTFNRDDRVIIKNLMIKSTSATFSKTGHIPTSDNKGDIYKLSYASEGVNGINLSNSLNCSVENVLIMGCSGYGVNTGTINYFKNVTTTHCKVGYKIYKDSRIISPYSSANEIGFHVCGPTNNITNIWCDQIIKYGVVIESEYNENVSNLILEGTFDQLGYSALCVKTDLLLSSVKLVASRVGQYFSGYSFNSIEKEDTDKCCVIYNNSKIYGCMIDIISSQMKGNDEGTAGLCPVAKIVNNNLIERSIINVPSSGESLTNNDNLLYSDNGVGMINVSELNNSYIKYKYDYNGIIGNDVNFTYGDDIPSHSALRGSLYFREPTCELFVNIYGGTYWLKVNTIN